MKTILFALLLALGCSSLQAVEVNKNCFCPTCPDHKKACAGTVADSSRKPTNEKVIKKLEKKPATGPGSKVNAN